MDDVRSRVGPFRLLGRLGQGGMGRLYLAAHEGVAGANKIVALKCVRPELANRPYFERLFLDEARVAIQLAHPNIVATHELGEVDGMFFISMEYVPGEDLAYVIERCRKVGAVLPLRVVIQVAVACASALQYAHTLQDSKGRLLGLVHCDVNPTNVMISYHGVTKLLDFGIAKFRSSSDSSRDGLFRGKVAYSAMEQLDGGPIDARTDIFCLGIVLWEMLTGRRLFNAGDAASIVDAVRKRPVAPPSLFRPEVPPQLDALVLDMLERDPSRRPQSAEAVGRSLEGQRSVFGSDVSESGLASWLTALFGSQRAQQKLRAAQGEVPAGVFQRPPKPILDLAEVTSSQPSPRVAWSTDAGGGTSVQESAGRAPPRLPPELASMAAREEGRPASIDELLQEIAPGERSTTLDVTAERQFVGPAQTRPPIWRLGIAGLALVVLGAVSAALFIGLPPAEDAPPPKPPPVVVVTSEPSGAPVFIDGEPTGMLTPAKLSGVSTGAELRVRVDFPSGGSVAKSVRVQANGETRVNVAAPPEDDTSP